MFLYRKPSASVIGNVAGVGKFGKNVAGVLQYGLRRIYSR